MSLSLSIVIPVLNEAENIGSLLDSLAELQQSGAELIIADGGSSDCTIANIGERAKVVCSPRGRAQQMNAGAGQAGGDWLLFLHADTRLPAEAGALMRVVAQTSNVEWGFFPVKLSGTAGLLRVVEKAICVRSRYSCIATGDQAIFVRREVFEEVGGYADIPLMEDIELCRRLKKRVRPVVPNRCVVTSSRRWEEKGVLRTIFTMWFLRGAYACGVSPTWLVRRYY